MVHYWTNFLKNVSGSVILLGRILIILHIANFYISLWEESDCEGSVHHKHSTKIEAATESSKCDLNKTNGPLQETEKIERETRLIARSWTCEATRQTGWSRHLSRLLHTKKLLESNRPSKSRRWKSFIAQVNVLLHETILRLVSQLSVTMLQFSAEFVNRKNTFCFS